METIKLRSIHKNIIRSILRRYKLNRADILGILVFGSVARGQADKKSDLDLIIIKKDDILNYKGLQYYRDEVNKISIDLNIMSQNCCIELLGEPDWQYRLYDAKLVSLNDIITCNRLSSWLTHIKKTIETNESRDFRISRHFGDIDKLIVKKDLCYSRKDKIVELFTLIEIAILVTKISIEKMKFLPHRSRNIISFLKRVEDSSVCWSNSIVSWWDHVVNQIQRNNPEFSLRRYDNVTELILKWIDKTRESAEEINGRAGIMHRSVLKLDASDIDRLNEVITWPFNGQLNEEQLFNSLSRIINLQKNRFLKSQKSLKSG